MQGRHSCLQDFAFRFYAVDFGIDLGIRCFSDLQSMSSYLGSVFIDDTENQEKESKIYSLMRYVISRKDQLNYIESKIWAKQIKSIL